MTEFRVKWQTCPHIHSTPRVLFVQAEDEASAKAVARDHIERKYGVEWFTIWECNPTPPLPAGHAVGEV